MASCRQVLFVSTVPLVYLDWSALERFLTRAQWFRNYHDDIRDQWRSHGHLDEWRRMATALLDFADRTHTRVTILSGEIHLGALGLMERGDTQIHQLISSGVAHHPLPPIASALFGLWGPLARGGARGDNGAVAPAARRQSALSRGAQLAGPGVWPGRGARSRLACGGLRRRDSPAAVIMGRRSPMLVK